MSYVKLYASGFDTDETLGAYKRMLHKNNLVFRRAETSEDFQKVFELQNKNLVRSLSESDLKDGFLSGEFTLGKLRAMNDSICIMTCFSGDGLCGYHIASTPEFNQTAPLLMQMLQQFDKISYKDKQLAEYECFIAGPSCIAKEYRGLGIYPQLISLLFDFLKETQNPSRLRISFASASNPRSLNAQKKIGCEIVGEFEFNSHKFMVLCLDLEGI